MTTTDMGAGIMPVPTREQVRSTLAEAAGCSNAEASRMIVVFKKAADDGRAYQLRQLERTMLAKSMIEIAAYQSALDMLAQAYLKSGQTFAYNAATHTISVVQAPARQ